MYWGTGAQKTVCVSSDTSIRYLYICILFEVIQVFQKVLQQHREGGKQDELVRTQEKLTALFKDIFRYDN